jgi:uncharacterized protein with ACT and thioredoxin-like domain
VAQAGAVINIVRAKRCMDQLFKQVVILIGGFGAAIESHCLRAIAPVDLHHAVGSVIKRFIPADRLPFVQCERLGTLSRFLRGFA